MNENQQLEFEELLKNNPGAFDSTRYENVSVLNDRTLTVIMAQPRSGSTLLLRLLNKACLTHCVGDRELEFMQSLVKIYGHSFHYIHNIYREHLWDGSFPDAYTGFQDQGQYRDHIARTIRQLLVKTWYGSGWCKTTLIGWGAHNDVELFVGMLRDLYENTDGIKLNIVWLVRNKKEIADSFITTPGNYFYEKESGRERLEEFAHNQREQFDEHYELHDQMITYKDLIEKPIECLKKCKPVYTPDPKIVEKVMNHKIRR